MSIPEENGGFLLNRVITKNVTAGTHDQNDTIDNIFSGVPTQYFESEPLTQALNIDMTFTEAVGLKGFAIINHNIPLETTVTLKYSSTGFGDIEAVDPVTITEKNTFVFIDRSFQYVRLQINPGSEIRIGELFPAQEIFQFPRNYHWGYGDEFNVAKEVMTSDSGQHFENPNPENGDDQAAEFEKLYMQFGPVGRQYLEEYQKLIRVGHKVFIPEFNKPQCFFGIVPEKKLKAQRSAGGDSYSLSFWEHSIQPL